MNVLVIGNGFDLAHGLPTKYSHFLEFCKRVFPIYNNVESKEVGSYQQEFLLGWNFNKEIKEALRNTYKSRKKITMEKNQLQIQTNYPRLDEMYSVIKNNIWIDYFSQSNIYQKENWIDFEREISEVIKSLDNDMHKLSDDYGIEDDIMDLSNKYLNNIYSDYTFTTRSVIGGACESITFREIRNKLLEDLKRLIRAFEIYLTEYVEKIDCKLVSPDIQKILSKKCMKINRTPVYDLFVLSFNYTNTYQRLYTKLVHQNNYIDYIHGKAEIRNTIESNNMVLGIDEYLSKKRRNKDTEFIAFKKFYQRIHKETGCKHKEWINIIKEDFADYQIELEKKRTEKDLMILKTSINKLKERYLNKHNVYIFGHSLDVTDKDILRDLILNDNVKTTIFYYNKDVMGQQIANLVKVIGQDELIRRTGGSTKTIEFKQQQDMVSI